VNWLMSESALQGQLVVSIEQAVAAPLCSSRLAMGGARVIKVERPEGDFARGYDRAVKGESAYFVWLNHGKESLILDLKERQDVDFLVQVISKADVFVQNLVPGATQRLGLGSEYLCEQFPRLVACDISGYGESGPYRDMKAYDLLVQCETGLAAITGSPEQPGRVGVSIADIACGLSAYARILESLLVRQKTGKGSRLQVSLFGALSDWMNVPYLHQVYGGKAPTRVGINHPSIAPYGAYPTGDGGTLVIGIQNDREFKNFCELVCAKPELASDERFARNPQRVLNRRQLDEEISEVFLGLSKSELVKRLVKASIAFSSLNSMEEFSQHPQLQLMTVETAAGPIEIIAPWGNTQPGMQSRVPGLGEHSQSIRAEFGHGQQSTK
jgi:itaconate CoA-transferase